MAASTIPLRNIASDLRRAADLPRKSKPRVLLIEDNKDATRWVQHALKKYASGRYKLECKECLSDGLSRLLDGGIDLVLLDLGLPDCSSPFTAAWVRQAAPQVPVVVLTADQSEETEWSLANRGIDKYLVKGNISCEGLVAAINDTLHIDLPGPDAR